MKKKRGGQEFDSVTQLCPIGQLCFVSSMYMKYLRYERHTEGGGKRGGKGEVVFFRKRERITCSGVVLYDPLAANTKK